LGLTVASVGAMTRNWGLARELEGKESALTRAKVEVETLELEQIYYRSEEYQEVAAKKYLGRAMPDETLLILPENSEYARTKYADEGIIAEERTNFEMWTEFVFGV